jgi:hypothetical protein
MSMKIMGKGCLNIHRAYISNFRILRRVHSGRLKLRVRSKDDD